MFALRKMQEAAAMEKKDIALLCSGTYKTIWGLPCAHILQTYKEQGTSIDIASIHPQWSLPTGRNSTFTSNVAVAARVTFQNAPPSGPKASTGRTLSGFEVLLKPQRLCSLCKQPGHNRARCPLPKPHSVKNQAVLEPPPALATHREITTAQ